MVEIRLGHANELARQRVGRGMLITAGSNSLTIGSVYLRLDQPEEPEIRDHLPGVPLLTHLQVVSSHRNQRVGLMLITAAEEVAADLGHDRLALTVNPDVERLYRRLG